MLKPLISKCSMIPAWHQLVPISGHVEESETARKLQLYATSIKTSVSTRLFANFQKSGYCYLLFDSHKLCLWWQITSHTNLIVKWLEEAINDVPIVQNKSNISAGRCVPGSNDIACMEELVLAVLSECPRYPVAIAIVHVGFVYYFSC